MSPTELGRRRHTGPAAFDPAPSARPAALERWRARLRLWSGCVLFVYVALHLANHALGLVSLDAMEAGRRWFLAIWRNPVGTAILYASFVVHPLNAFWSIYRRRTLRMPRWEATQICLGLAIPALLVSHAVGTRLAYEWFGQEDRYHRLVLIYWDLRPEIGVKQSVMLIVAWLHGSIGIHFWLRLRPWYPRVAPLLLSLAVLLPAVALLGFAEGGREAASLAAKTGGPDALLQQSPRLGADQRAVLQARGVDILRRLRRGPRTHAARPRRPPALRAPFSRHPRRLRLGRGNPRPHRVLDPGGEPIRRRPPRIGMRRPGPLLHVPRARAERSHRHPRGEPGGGPRPRASGRPARGAPGVSGAAARRRGGEAPRRAAGAAERRLRPLAVAGRHRAGGDDPLRRPPAVHRPRRAPAALRRGVLPEPLLRGDGTRDRARRRHHQPVHRRRRDGALRRGRRPRRGMPSRTGRRARHGGRHRRAQRGNGRRPR